MDYLKEASDLEKYPPTPQEWAKAKAGLLAGYIKLGGKARVGDEESMNDTIKWLVVWNRFDPMVVFRHDWSPDKKPDWMIENEKMV